MRPGLDHIMIKAACGRAMKRSTPVLFNEQKNSAFSEVQRITAMPCILSYTLASIIHTSLTSTQIHTHTDSHAYLADL